MFSVSSSDSDVNSICSYSYSPEKNNSFSNSNGSEQEEGNYEGTIDFRLGVAKSFGKRRRSGDSAISRHVKRFRSSGQHSSSRRSYSSGEEKEEEDRGSIGRGFSEDEKEEIKRGRRDQKCTNNSGQLHNYFSSFLAINKMDTRLSPELHLDFGNDSPVSIVEETIRSEEDHTFIDGFPFIRAENVFCISESEARIKEVFIKEFSECPLKQRVVHDIFGTKCNHGDIKLDYQQLCENFLGPSSSSRTMETTSTSSTIVHTPIIPVDVLSSNTSTTKSIEDILEDSFQVGSSRSNTGLISQSISRRIPGSTSTLTSPGERGFQVVKLDVFDFSKISKKPTTEWWKEANYRSTFILQSPADPNYQMVMKLLLAATTK